MPIETFLTTYLHLLATDKERIESLKSAITQAKANGKPTHHLYKDLVNAHEKQIKHLKEYDKWLIDNKIEVQVIEDDATTTTDNQATHNEEENCPCTSDNRDDFSGQLNDHKTQSRDMKQNTPVRSNPANQTLSKKNHKKKYKLKPYKKDVSIKMYEEFPHPNPLPEG